MFPPDGLSSLCLEFSGPCEPRTQALSTDMSHPVNEELQSRYELEGRGFGAREHYRPWRQLERGGPQSPGRSHLIFNPFLGRHHHLFSDIQLRALLQVLGTSPQDCREHFPLRPTYVEPEFLLERAPLTGLQAAQSVGVRYPMHASGAPKVLTITFYVTWTHRRLALDVYQTRPGETHVLRYSSIKNAYWASRRVTYRALAVPGGWKPFDRIWLQWSLDGLRCEIPEGELLTFLRLLDRSDRRSPMLQRLATAAEAICMPRDHAVIALKHAVLHRLWRPDEHDLPHLAFAWRGRTARRSDGGETALEEALRCPT